MASIKNAATEAKSRPGMLLAGLAILFVGLNLRPAITSVASVAPEIDAELGLGSTLTGLLTTTPILAFVLLSTRAPGWGHKVGVARMIMLSLGILGIGFLLRLIPSTLALFAGMAVAGLAITIGNVLLPTYIKARYPDKSGPLMSVYTVSLFVGPALAAGGTVPIANALGSWRKALFFWVIFVVIAALVWWPHVSNRPIQSQAQKAPSLKPLWSHLLAWAVTFYFAVMSMMFYTISAWLPTALIDRGMASDRASNMLMLLNVVAIPFALVVSLLIHRTRSQVWATLPGSVLVGAGIAGIAFAPLSSVTLWALLLGFGNGIAAGITFSLPLLRSSNAPSTAALGAMSQSAGYALSALGPVGAGLLHSLTGSWPTVMMVLVGLIAVQAICGLFVGQDRHVDIFEGEHEAAGLHGAEPAGID